jgi:hypothetical protein
MKKRLLAAFLASALCLITLTACAGNNSGTAPRNAMSVKAETVSTAEQVYAAQEMDFPQAFIVQQCWQYRRP